MRKSSFSSQSALSRRPGVTDGETVHEERARSPYGVGPRRYPSVRHDGPKHRFERDIGNATSLVPGNDAGMLEKTPDSDWRRRMAQIGEVIFQHRLQNGPAVPARQNVDVMHPCLSLNEAVASVPVSERIPRQFH